MFKNWQRVWLSAHLFIALWAEEIDVQWFSGQNRQVHTEIFLFAQPRDQQYQDSPSPRCLKENRPYGPMPVLCWDSVGLPTCSTMHGVHHGARNASLSSETQRFLLPKHGLSCQGPFGFHKWWYPKMDDLGVPLFQETSISQLPG